MWPFTRKLKTHTEIIENKLYSTVYATFVCDGYGEITKRDYYDSPYTERYKRYLYKTDKGNYFFVNEFKGAGESISPVPPDKVIEFMTQYKSGVNSAYIEMNFEGLENLEIA